MKGMNSLELNEATMLDIIQYWLDNKAIATALPVPKAKSFKRVDAYPNTSFIVRLESPEE